MAEGRLSRLSLEFAVRIVELVKDLNARHEWVISRQICRSGTSIGANIREADYAASGADFVLRLRVSLKEANETGYWLELLFRTDYIDKELFDKLSAECATLRVLLIKSINTANGD